MAKYYDTLLGEYIQNPGARGLGLDKIALQSFAYQMISYDEVTAKKKINFNEVDVEEAAKYSGEDVYMTAKLYEKQTKDLQKQPDTIHSILHNIELPLMQVLAQMEIDGVKVDRDKLKEIGTKLENEINRLEKTIFNQAGEEFNINSPKQVGEILFEKLGLPKGKKTKTGYSVGAEVLEELGKNFEIASNIALYRHYAKLLSTYVEGIWDLLDDADRVHTNYNQSVTSTGRLSSTNPNLQNIPTGSGVAGEIREAFISRWDEGNIMAFDYSQVEIRILAAASGDKNLKEVFEQNQDMHAKTAEFIGTNERRIAKAVNFGVIYGISAFGLSKNIDIPIADAKKYIDGFYASYSQVADFFEKTLEIAKKNGYVETLYGRRRYLPALSDRNAIIRKSAEREAINMPIQGTSADIIKLAMIEVDQFIRDNNLKSKMILQVHDELVFDVYPGEAKIFEAEIPKIMEHISDIPGLILKVDGSSGKNWKEAK